MLKLLNGIIDFRQNVRPKQRDLFENIAYVQTPTTLMIACSDSRVAPNVFASTDPGDVFVVRNVGNFVPPLNKGILTDETGQSVWAAVEFSLTQLNVQDIIVCGHSECGAIRAIHHGITEDTPLFLKKWLNRGAATLQESCSCHLDTHRPAHDLDSQKNAILQTEHLKTHPLVQEKMRNGTLHLHSWWFDIADATVMAFDATSEHFVPIDESFVLNFITTRNS